MQVALLGIGLGLIFVGTNVFLLGISITLRKILTELKAIRKHIEDAGVQQGK